MHMIIRHDVHLDFELTRLDSSESVLTILNPISQLATADKITAHIYKLTILLNRFKAA